MEDVAVQVSKEETTKANVEPDSNKEQEEENNYESEAPVAEAIKHNRVAHVRRAVAQLVAPSKKDLTHAADALYQLLAHGDQSEQRAVIETLEARMAAAGTDDERLALFYLCDLAAKQHGTSFPLFFNHLLQPRIGVWFQAALEGNSACSKNVRHSLYRMVCKWNKCHQFSSCHEWVSMFEVRMSVDERAHALRSSTSLKRRAAEALATHSTAVDGMDGDEQKQPDEKRPRPSGRLGELLSLFNKSATVIVPPPMSPMEAVANLQRLLAPPVPPPTPPSASSSSVSVLRNLLDSIKQHPSIQQLVHAPAPVAYQHSPQDYFPPPPPLLQVAQQQQQQQQQAFHPFPPPHYQQQFMHVPPPPHVIQQHYSSMHQQPPPPYFSHPPLPPPPPSQQQARIHTPPTPDPWEMLKARPSASLVASLYEDVKFRCKTCQTRCPTADAMRAHMEIHFAEHNQRRLARLARLGATATASPDTVIAAPIAEKKHREWMSKEPLAC
jgi:hypothetical protein